MPPESLKKSNGDEAIPSSESSLSATANGKVKDDGSAADRRDSFLSSSALAAAWRTRLLVCATGICVCYLYYGMLQETLFRSASDLRRVGPIFVLMLQCISNVFVALIWKQVMKILSRTSSKQQASSSSQQQQQQASSQQRSPPLNHRLFLLTAGAYVGAMGASNEAIPLVSYPVAVLAKSCKLVPTMVVGQLLRVRSYSRREWTASLCITTGIALFHWSRLQGQSLQHPLSPSSSSTIATEEKSESKLHHYGQTLLFVSLSMDGLLNSCQQLLKRSGAAAGEGEKNSRQALPRYRPPNAVETMLYVNLYALLYLIPWSLYNGQFGNGVRALSGADDDPTSPQQLWWKLFLINATSSVGQIFIFLTIHWFSPILCTTITTTRKFFSILLSVYRFGHAFTIVQWAGIGLVFSGLYLVILLQQQQQQQRCQDQVMKATSGAKRPKTD